MSKLIPTFEDRLMFNTSCFRSDLSFSHQGEDEKQWRMRAINCYKWSANQKLIYCFVLCAVLLCSSLQCCAASDSITTGIFIRSRSNETLLSSGKRFELGFFNNGRYVGIWYYLWHPTEIVWIANRDNPLPDLAAGLFGIVGGNLTLSDENGTSYFSASLSSSSRRTTARLLNTGNLVVSNDLSGERLWESFAHPTDTFLPGMKMDENLTLTSWSSPNDPRRGNFTFEQDQDSGNGYTIMMGSKTYWRSTEPTVGFITDSNNMYGPATALLLNSSNVNSNTNSNSPYRNITIPVRKYDNARLLMNSAGQIQYFTWDNRTGWSLRWSEPQDQCHVYNACGNFGVCNSRNRTLCRCLPGFEPRSLDNWNVHDFSSGCKRTSEICGEDKKSETFFDLVTTRVEKPESVPESVFSVSNNSQAACRNECLSNCQCQAYWYNEANNTQRRGTDRCWIWTDLKNLQEGYSEDGHNISIRIVPSSTVGSNPKQPGGPEMKQKSTSFKTAAIVIVVFFMVLLLCIISFIFCRRRMVANRQESTKGSQALRLYDTERRVKNFIDSAEFKEEDKKEIDVPFFDLESILEATDYFSDANKLGQGGFGPVYKGKFPAGQEIAVKRLSSHSGQGLEEFKNEVVLIAKLQHRNLVRLLGYCIKGDEQILLYEYMPNKSLDAFIFDRIRCLLLDWGKRFDIIMGIARGLLYLHQDSRLRIIHRDLKTSNILLDEEMTPKISDFGLARIVGGKETEANTNRVVGTYGYMSPEYALDGLFSVKSDVFSFGVIVLEIVSGKRNTGFYQSQQALHLLSYAWRLWKEEKALDLMDRMLLESSNRGEILKCINVGLLCVQEDPGDRPNISNVLSMLGSETGTLPIPKEPAFVAKKWISTGPSSSSSSQLQTCSVNEITSSTVEGR